jgi:hypothetical protein
MRDNVANMQSEGIILIDYSLSILPQWNQEPVNPGGDLGYYIFIYPSLHPNDIT